MRFTRQQPPTPPLERGQLVTVQSYGEDLSGTVIDVQPAGDDHWEIWVEVLASFGVGTSRHVIDGAGREVDRRTAHHGLLCA